MIPNPQPLVLNGDGTTPNCFFSGAAKVVLADENDVQLWERDPVTSSQVSSFGSAWDSISIYGLNEVVTFNDVLYVSIIQNNQNNNPSSVPSAWTQFDLLKRWNVNETYKSGDPVTGTDFTVYISTGNGNVGNNPVGDGGVNWVASGTGSGGLFAFIDWSSSVNYGEGSANIVTGSDGKYYVSLQAGNLNNDPVSTTGFWEWYTTINPNMLINGGFDFDQRVAVNWPVNGYGPDRFFITGNTGSAPVPQDTFGNVINFDGTGFSQGIELSNQGDQYPLVLGKTFTFSFYALLSGVTISALGIWRDNVGDGTNQVVEPNISALTAGEVVDGYTKYTATFEVSTVPAATNNTFEINVGVAGGGTISFADWKMEEGSVATPFIRSGNTLAGEYVACRRYTRLSDVNTRVAEYTYEMRDAPAVSGAGPYLYEAEL